MAVSIILKQRTLWIPVAIGIVFVIAATAFVPLAGALQFGGDEGYELMKGFLCSRGFALYEPVWSDQPPVHTALLSWAFQLFGPSVFSARLITVGFSALLLGALYRAIQLRSGHGTATVAVLLLVVSPYFLELSVSAMIVVPSMSLAVCSVLLLFLANETRRRICLFWSGFALGLALQTKFTAALFIPAILAEILRAERSGGPGNWPARTAATAGCWAAGAVVAFGGELLFYPGASIELLWRPHFSAETWSAFAESSGRFGMNHMLWAERGIAAAAVAGMLWIFGSRRWDLLFPVVALATAYVAHLIHRPFWYFHYVHLSIPLAWLAAIALTDPLRWV